MPRLPTSRPRTCGAISRSTVVLCLALGLSACGGSSDEDQIRTTVVDYLMSTVSGDGPGACRQMTENGRRALLATAKPTLDEYDPATDCATAVRKVYEGNLAAGNDLPLAPDIRKQAEDTMTIKVDGDVATVTLGGEDTTEPTLKRVAGAWKIDDLGNGAG